MIKTITIKFQSLEVFAFSGFFCFPNNPSKKMPANTIAVPTHCLRTKLLPKNRTEAKTVKNFLVVVMMEQGRGPKSETVWKMKNWPKAEATEKEASSQRTEGWR